jgi:hypothetical protein
MINIPPKRESTFLNAPEEVKLTTWRRAAFIACGPKREKICEAEKTAEARRPTPCSQGIDIRPTFEPITKKNLANPLSYLCPSEYPTFALSSTQRL